MRCDAQCTPYVVNLNVNGYYVSINFDSTDSGSFKLKTYCNVPRVCCTLTLRSRRAWFVWGIHN